MRAEMVAVALLPWATVSVRGQECQYTSPITGQVIDLTPLNTGTNVVPIPPDTPDAFAGEININPCGATTCSAVGTVFCCYTRFFDNPPAPPQVFSCGACLHVAASWRLTLPP